MALAPVSAVSLEWMLFAIASLFVGTRFYIRIFKHHVFESIDWLILSTWGCFVITATCDTVMVANGFKDPTLSFTLGDPHGAFAEFSKPKLIKLLKILYSSSMPYYLSLWGVKFTFQLLYYKIFRGLMRPKLRIVLHILSAFVIATFIVVMAMNIFYCWPIRLNWEVQHPEAACITYFTYAPYIISLSFHIATEIFIFSMFFPILVVLKKSTMYDKSIAFVFLIGFLGVCVNIGRTAFLVTASSQPVISTAQTLAALEQAVGLIVICLLGLRTMIRKRISFRISMSISFGSKATSNLNSKNSKGSTLSQSQSRSQRSQPRASNVRGTNKSRVLHDDDDDLEPGVVENIRSIFRDHPFGSSEDQTPLARGDVYELQIQPVSTSTSRPGFHEVDFSETRVHTNDPSPWEVKKSAPRQF